MKKIWILSALTLALLMIVVLPGLLQTFDSFCEQLLKN